MNTKLKINEIFYSIQGESTYSGMPCIFIRLTGCNLRCSYCDTQYAFQNGTYMHLEEIIEKIMPYKCKLIEITGGEPLYQENTPLLVTKLIQKGFNVLIETNGSYDISIVDKRAVKIVDIKCPSSNEASATFLQNLEKIDKKDEIKFVIGSTKDYEYAKNIVEKREIKTKNILFSPLKSKEIWLANKILEDNLNVRLNIQIHKTIWQDEHEGIVI